VHSARYRRFLGLLLALLALVVVLNGLNRYLAHDELEHVHATWYVANGQRPWVDFFENHHPALWFLLVPVLRVFGESTTAILAMRLLMLLLLFGIAAVVAAITRSVTHSVDTGRLAVITLLSTVMFVEKAVEIRPDVPQVFFGLLSFLVLLRCFRSGRPRHAVLSGFLAALSFLFLQKALFLLAAFTLLFLIQRGRRRMPPVCLGAFILAFLLPVFALTLLLLHSGSFSDYILCCWRVHLGHVVSFLPLDVLARSWAQNLLFWGIALLAWARIVFGRRRHSGLGWVGVCGLAYLLSVFAAPHPYRQYFMLPLALMAVGVAWIIHALFRRYGFGEGRKMAAVAVFVLVPLALNGLAVAHSHGPQLRKIDFVLRNTDPGERVYDGDIRFNVFRRDLHYFWYAIQNGGLETYNRLTGGRFADYDACRLVREMEPRFISRVGLDPDRCGLRDRYRDTPFSHLYARKEVFD